MKKRFPTGDELNQKLKEVLLSALRREQYFWEENKTYFGNVFDTEEKTKWCRVARRFIANPKMKFFVGD